MFPIRLCDPGWTRSPRGDLRFVVDHEARVGQKFEAIVGRQAGALAKRDPLVLARSDPPVESAFAWRCADLARTSCLDRVQPAQQVAPRRAARDDPCSHPCLPSGALPGTRRESRRTSPSGRSPAGLAATMAGRLALSRRTATSGGCAPGAPAQNVLRPRDRCRRRSHGRTPSSRPLWASQGSRWRAPNDGIRTDVLHVPCHVQRAPDRWVPLAEHTRVHSRERLRQAPRPPQSDMVDCPPSRAPRVWRSARSSRVAAKCSKEPRWTMSSMFDGPPLHPFCYVAGPRRLATKHTRV